MSEGTKEPNKNGTVHIEDEMRGAYLDYAMSVIIGRALPDVRDGLKPVHRRVLFAMNEVGNHFNKPYKKSARIVGDVLGKYHPHGDTAVYDTMVRMAQDFSLRYPLIDGQGNFGSIDGDSAAAMRYTEVRMAKITEQMLGDIEKETVDFGPNFDESLKEPKVLPARIPNLLINGSSGIAVGMATNIPPHNLTEVVTATLELIENPNLTVDDLMKYVKGPDFPTGASIINSQNIKKAYRTGRGVITIRGKAEIEIDSKDREHIIITEIPYQVNKSKMIEKIADLVKDKKIEGIADLRDESNRDGIRVVIDVKKNENSNVLLNRLYKLTSLQESFGISLLAVHQNRPKVFNLKDMLWAFVEHRKDVVIRRTNFELKKAEARAHILEGLKIAVENIDQVVALIKASSGPDDARKALMTKFVLSEKQAQAILDMRLQRLTGLERDKIVQEYTDILKYINSLIEILANETLVFKIIKEELVEILETYGDKRKTEIAIGESADFEEEDLIADEDTLVAITHKGYIKRSDPALFKSQNRGGKGIRAIKTIEGDFVSQIFQTTTFSDLLCFTSGGKVHLLKVYRIPEASRTSRGKPIVNLIKLTAGEKVKAILPFKKKEVEDCFIAMVTKNGLIKKTAVSEFNNIRTSGIAAISIQDGDELVNAALTEGKNDLFLVTANGKCIRFSEEDVRPMGRTARGVTGVKLETNGPPDSVVAMEVLKTDTSDEELLTVTEKGYGKRTQISEYRGQTRGGKGILCMKITDRNGAVVAACQTHPQDEVMMMSDRGTMIKMQISGISEQGRVTQGVRLMNVSFGEKVVAVELVREDDEKPGDENN